MLDFLTIAVKKSRDGVEVFPKFKVGKSSDLMIRGRDFYAIWIDEIGLWSTDEEDAVELIDKQLDEYVLEHPELIGAKVKYMWDSDSGVIDKWHRYCQKQCRDSFVMLDEKLIFSNTVTKKNDYASKKLNYPLEEGEYPSWEKLISTLYSPEEREKIEWSIGSIITGDSKTLQKFLVLYGSAGTGKSTILNIIQMLFEGYYSVFDAKALGSSNNSFALEAFSKNPLVAIQHDGDLSKIEDNTRLNSLVSHELMTINEKFKSTYSNRFKCFLYMGTNKPVKITDGKSGLLRRLIDVTPTGNKLGAREYKQATKQVIFELGAIAYHCKEVYLANPNKYDDYIPINMMGASNDFYNFIIDSYSVFLKEDGTSLKAAFAMYKTYCEEANVPSFARLSRMIFKEELKNYFKEYSDRLYKDGSSIRSYYSGFRLDKFENDIDKPKVETEDIYKIEFEQMESIFDKEMSDCPAQYATKKEIPSISWTKCKTTLKDIDTSKIHYVKVPENHIVIDFDIKDENGKKSFEKNLEAASKWPKTYAELSKSGEGIHLHYIYSGDVSKLSRVFDYDIEVKVFTGNSSLRRKLTKCNNLPIATISSGLPLKGEKMVSKNVLINEKGLRTTIKKCLNKEVHFGTKCNVDFIYKILNDAYDSGLKYDVSDMFNDIFGFAAQSTNQSDYCIKLVSKMKFKSDDVSDGISDDEKQIIFCDVEAFPNLLLVNWKFKGKDKPMVRMINPSPDAIGDLIAENKYNLIGFNCRRYDNHILYAAYMGYTNEQLYNLSQKIINNEPNCYFGEAYNISYTDVYDFAAKKQSLKKWEIELGLHHKELGLPWDQPVPEELWETVAEYCDNDVLATEAVFDHLAGDFAARKILADLAGLTVNDTTNTLTTKIIFGSNRHPQDQFNYRFLGDMSEADHTPFDDDYDTECTVFDSQGRPIFPGYKFENGKSTYRDEEVGEGGYVYSEPGMYGDVALLDITSMHPSSIEDEELFGEEYTKRFSEIKQARILIKHDDIEEAKKFLEGKLEKYLNDPTISADLAQALKIAINSVYGLTSARFDNPFRDPRNIDNIVAKRGALFMINLKHEVQRRGYTVAHIKTDSIKIPDADPEIINFVMKYGEMYGYKFEHEATYERMCLVNDAVYIAKYKDGKHAGEWTPTGKQFAVPYVFKTLFSKEPITFNDMCETFAVSKGDLYLDFNEKLPDVTEYEKNFSKLEDQYKKGKISDVIFESECSKLRPLIEEGHDLHFVGRVGQFTPVKPGNGGGILYRVNGGKNYAAPGSTGYRWVESELLSTTSDSKDIIFNEYGDKVEVAGHSLIDSNYMDIIDRRFYDKLVDDAVEEISKYGDFEWFVSDTPYEEPPFKGGRII